MPTDEIQKNLFYVLPMMIVVYYGATWRIFRPKHDKKKKKSTQRKFLILQKMKLSIFTSIFSRKSCSYISGNENHKKISYIFSKDSFSYISGNGNPEKNSLNSRKQNCLNILGTGTFWARKMKKPALKKLIFSGNGTFKTQA